MQLLLLSNSTLPGKSYLGWPQKYLSSFLSNVKTVAFIPYAGITISYDAYTEAVCSALKGLDLQVENIDTVNDKLELINKCDCIMVGGGNTFKLLQKLQQYTLVDPIAKKVRQGTKYVGWSAGANLACPTIKTTNDMPVVEPESFEALNLVSYQINPHFTNATLPNHGGETREARIKEYLIENPSVSVVGLPEGMLLHHSNGACYIKGKGTALLFKNNLPVKKLKEGKLIID